jgi:hypothetical protein
MHWVDMHSLSFEQYGGRQERVEDQTISFQHVCVGVDYC